MTGSKFEQALDKHLEKYYPTEQKLTCDKTNKLLEQGTSLFNAPAGFKKTGLQKFAGGLGKALGTPGALRGAIQGATRALDDGGLTGTISQKLRDFAGKDDEKKTDDQGLFGTQPAAQAQQPQQQTKLPDVNRDLAGFQAVIKQQWQALPPQIQQAYGSEAAFLNIKTIEAKHSK